MSRVSVPTAILASALVLLALGRRIPCLSFLHDLVSLSTIAMTLSAMDFAARDGLAGSDKTLLSVAAAVLFLGLITSALVRRYWVTKLVWTGFLGLASSLWVAYLV